MKASIFIIFFLLYVFKSTDIDPRKNLYKIIYIRTHSDYQIDALLQYTGDEDFYGTDDNPIIKDLKLTLSFQTPSQLRFTLRSFTSSRYEIPEEYPYPHDEKNYTHPLPSSFLYKIELDEKNFSLKVLRKKTNELIFDTSDLFFIFSDRYLEISSKLQTEYIFGLGERVHNFKLDFPGRYTIWNRDLPKVIDEGEGAQNTYGLHPMYLLREKGGDFHIVYLRNSNGMDVFLNNSVVKKDGKYTKIKTITYKVVGGIFDFKFFLGGENVEELVQDYHKYLGGWAMQPFWSFGYHQSRWGYTDLEKINSTLTNFKEYGMPLDAIWMDIDYMINHNIFTIDPDRYNLTLMKSLLKEEFKKKLILIIDPGVAVNKSDISYQRGIEKGIFIKDSHKKPLKACVWPGQTHFPDFFNPNTQDYWNEMFDMLFENVEFDGIWLDMNELSNFVDGKVGKGECGNGENNGDTLSGGERRRTEIARALATDPKFILLDEPFAGVDPIAVEDIQAIVAKLKFKNIGILITDHNVNETLSICDRAYLLIDGKIFEHGTAEELAGNEQVRRLYLGRNFELKRKDYLHDEAAQ